ncbi:prolyl oligopeptidase family serine peptidase [Hymenobacter psychrophilus]|uniref:prolyl oligopeptidase n=1 Tax=Hymenobacter psychrophilus TaxID=651662 RepID=A0A1H3JMC1_9BACT|nr:prolyl oligopeptidase family serine peptidase [Hymenobacter psychrophilus]SDY41083.1 prolyl oligopeptidase . Serine peptidase. MEROPS family S09A [Hymenobacter psychrophilus]
MRKLTIPVLALASLAACRSSQPTTPTTAVAESKSISAPAAKFVLNYPDTKKTDQKDDYFGTSVADPYRWLEDADAPETKSWVTAENKVTFGYLEQIPFREKIRERLTTLWNYEKFGIPHQEGNKLYFSKNDGLQNQSVLYVQQGDGTEGQPDVLLDPNKFSADGTTALAGAYYSNDQRYMAYATSGGGSDWQTMKVLDLKTRQTTSDQLDWVKVSGAAWYKNGFFYSRYDAPKAGESKLAGKNEFHKVYYHQLGKPQSTDRLVYEDPKSPLGFRTVGTTDDERFLVLYLTDGKADGNRLSVRDLTDRRQEGNFTSLITNYEHNNSVVGNVGGQLLVLTNNGAPNYRVVLIDPKKPQEKNWKTVLPETGQKLEGVDHVSGYLVASYLKDASSLIKVYTEKGEFKHDVALPAIGTASGFGGKRGAKQVYYAFTSFTYPTTIYKYDLATNTSTVFRAPKVDVNPADYVTTQVFYQSKDGTKVPMFITHKKGLKLDGQNPTYLYAYGGFNISLTPSFSVARMLWLENGGVLAIPNLRGGGEYGEAWHQAGMTPNKQNVFDDFIAAAEYLKVQGYTSTDKLAMAGGSNGGLLVGATMTQRPDLCKVAFPAVGVMDMLRYQKFTIGWNWAPEYGTSDNYEQFQNLYRFSPLHNLKPATYPATMITTADHDDRVVPAHSFKFAAALQAANEGSNPQLIRVDVNAGHGAGKSTKLQIQEWADIWSFAFYNMGVKPFGK